MKSKLFFLVLVVVLTTSCEKTEIKEFQNSKPATDEQQVYLLDKSIASTCSCVQYVKNRLNITGSTANAQDWGLFLKARGYYRVYSPQNKDVVIFKAGYGSGINATYGHIGIIGTASLIGSGASAFWRIKVVGANQGPPFYTEYNCTNVNYTLISDVNTTQKKNNIEYWRK